MALSNVLLLGTETPICSTQAGETKAVLSISFCNTDTATRTFSLYAYPTGGSLGALSTVLSNMALPAGDTYMWTANEKFILAPLDKITATADVASKVAICCNYMVI